MPEVRTPSSTDLQFATSRKGLHSTTFIHKIAPTQPKKNPQPVPSQSPSPKLNNGFPISPVVQRSSYPHTTALEHDFGDSDGTGPRFGLYTGAQFWNEDRHKYDYPTLGMVWLFRECPIPPHVLWTAEGCSILEAIDRPSRLKATLRHDLEDLTENHGYYFLVYSSINEQA